MIEKDNIQELFSKSFENHASAVKPELWTGVQAKMAAAGMVSGGAATTVKGVSALAKWLIGTAAVTTIGVTTYVVLSNNSTEQPKETVVADNNIHVDRTTKTENNAVSSSTTNSTNVAKLKVDKQSSVPSVDNHVVQTINNGNNPIENQIQQVSNSNQNNPGNTNSSSNTVGTNSNITQGGQTSGNSVNPTSGGSNKPILAPKETTIVNAPSSKPSTPEAKVELPNVFTPNFDRNNDYFEIISSSNVETFEIQIFDQNGKKVFTSNEIDFKWDGNDMSNNPCVEGIFSYQYTVKNEDKINSKKGFIYLKR